MTKVKTKSGFSCEVDETRLKDWRIVKAIAQCDSKDETKKLQGMTFMVPFLLGEDGEEALMDFIAKEEGYPSTEKVVGLFQEILLAVGEKTKKSQSSQG